MAELTTLIGTFFIGMLASFIGTMVGSGGLISIAFLIFLGLPPQMAIATDRLGTLGQITSAFLKYKKAKKIVWKYVPTLIILSLAGALIGSKLLLNIENHLLEKIVGVLLIIMIPIILAKKELGTKQRTHSKKRMIVGFGLYFLISILSGLIGTGGTLIFYTLMTFLGLTIIQASATDLIPWGTLAISSTIIFAMNGLINYPLAIALMLGMSLGAYLGANTALKKGNHWVKRLFVVIVVISGVKLLLF